MRRITWGLLVIAVLFLTVSVANVVERGGGGASHGAATSAAIWAPPHPGTAADPTPVPAAQQTTPVPVSTLLVSPKPGDSYLLYWFNLTDSVMGEVSATTWGGPTVRPVVSTRGNWLEIRLDSRPNGTTAWVRKQDVTVTQTAYRIVISVSQKTLTLYQNGYAISTAPVGVGKSIWPTPTGPSFVDQVIATPANEQRIYGPTVLITGSHSNVLTDFDGGDGTVAIHGYPSDPASTMGVASSHGCIRANPQTMTALAGVPAGTPIDINP